MKKFLVLVMVLMMVCGACASAEWLYATRGDTYIHVRANVASDSIGVFMKGEKIWVEDHIYTDDGRNWCKVKYFGKTGYISDRYSDYDVYNSNSYREVGKHTTYENNEDELYNYDDVDYDPEEYYQFPDQEEFEFMVTKSTKIRAWADSEATVLGKVRKGTTLCGSLIYTSDNGTAWLEIHYDSYQYGYVPMTALKLVDALFDGSYPRMSYRMKVSGGRVNVRDDASIDANDIGTVYRGDIVYAIFYVCVDNGERRIWAYCNDEDGNGLGFISMKYLKVA